MDTEAEVELIRRAQSGDHRAFGKLAMAYERVLFNLALRMTGNREDARDLTQAAFLKAYRGLAGFDASRRFYSWIYRIMLNEAINYVNARRPVEPLDEQMVRGHSTPEDDYELSHLGSRVDAALMELNMEQRQVIVLRHFLSLSYQEMAEVLDTAEKTVKSRLFTARQTLGQALRRHGVTQA
jgi:RNA polymerase sigma-70 factor, ECF subfamily